MIVKTDDFSDMVNKATINKTIPNMHLDFREDGVYTKIIDSANVAATDSILKKAAFLKDYKPIGNIFIKNSLLFAKFLQTFDKEIELKIENNILKIFDKTRCVNVVLGEEEACDRAWKQDFPVFPKQIEIQTTKEFLSKAIADAEMLGVDSIIFRASDGKFSLYIGEDSFDSTENTLDITSKESVMTKVSSDYVQNIVKALKNKVTILLGTNLPIYFIEKLDNIEVKTLVAPRVENTDGQDKKDGEENGESTE